MIRYRIRTHTQPQAKQKAAEYATMTPEQQAAVDRRRVKHTSSVLLGSKVEKLAELISDPTVLRAWKKLRDSNIGGVFLDLYQEASVRQHRYSISARHADSSAERPSSEARHVRQDMQCRRREGPARE
jgi:hypothetical protein